MIRCRAARVEGCISRLGQVLADRVLAVGAIGPNARALKGASLKGAGLEPRRIGPSLKGTRISWREWRWAVGLAVTVMALTAVPYLMGFAAQTDQWRFGGLLIASDDGNSYIAKMGQGARGAWLFTLPYTSEPQPGAFIYIFYLLLGKLSGTDHTAQVVAYHLARLVCGAALLVVSYRFLAEFLPFVHQRRLAMVLVAFGGGLGWLPLVLGWYGNLPVDFYSPEAFTFLTIYTSPHLAAARALFLLALLAHLRRRSAWAGLALFGVSLIQPLYVLVAWTLIGAEITLRRFAAPLLERIDLLLRRSPHPDPLPFGGKESGRMKAGGPPLPLGEGQGVRETIGRSLFTNHWSLFTSYLPLLITISLSAPAVVYTILVFSLDPILRQWNSQNILTSPPPLDYLLAYGALLVFAPLGWRVVRRRTSAWLAAGWVLLAPIMVYAPIATQRRLIEGLQLPLVALAVAGLSLIKRRWRRVTVPVLLCAALAPSVIFFVRSALSASTPGAPIFHHRDQLTVFDWLRQNAEPGEVGMGTFDTGNLLPVYTPLVAYIGHGPETLYLKEKEPRVAAFFRPETGDAERQRLLAEGRIRFVLYGPAERALGGFDLDRASYLRRRFAQGEYAVYQVIP
jgi:hypothetical protein